tara:strand:- start:2318 stop:2788 length:471 start_codon:yes stop_codon:yes gene_type:complete
MQPVGVIRSSASDDEIRDRSGEFESIIEIHREYEEALDSLDGYSHIYILSYFHKLREEQVGPLKVKPRRLLRRGFKLENLPTVGIFALDSPTRPNPIGLSLVRILSRDGRRIVVSGLDCFDGTPVLDIKPYNGEYKADQYSLPSWYSDLIRKAGHV